MTTYFELQPDIFAKHVPKLVTPLADDIYFRGGVVMERSFELPLIFKTGHSAENPPKGFHSRLVPLMSDAFVAAIRAVGVTNLQYYRAELHGADGTIWNDYHAVNVVGLIACADLSASEFTEIVDRPGNAPPLMAFEELKVDAARAHDALLFRLAESPGVILIADRVVSALRAQRSDEDWGITLDER